MSIHSMQTDDVTSLDESTELLDIPDELLDAVCVSLNGMLNGPAVLACLAACCTRTRRALHDPEFVARRALERDSGCTGVRTLQQLSLLEALQNIGPCRAVFMGACTEIRTASIARLDDIAKLLHLHPRATFVVEAHTGRHAPSAFAPALTRQRARAIVAHLERLGVDTRARCMAMRGWGKQIAVAAGWEPGLESARAELFLSLDGVELPSRPHYYDGQQLERDGKCRRRLG